MGDWPSDRWKVRANVGRDWPLISASLGTVQARAASEWMACNAAVSRGSVEA